MGMVLRAVVVGIDRYKYAKSNLRGSCNDATEIADMLKNSTAFHVEQITLLRNEEATRKAIQASLDQAFTSRGMDRNTIALFYFAGHSLENEKDKRVSLCCYDADRADPEPGSIRMNDIYEKLASCSAECVIVIIDACQSGAILLPQVGHISQAQLFKQAVEALRYPEGKTAAILGASASDEEARESQKPCYRTVASQVPAGGQTTPADGEKAAKHWHGHFTYEVLRAWRDGSACDPADSMVYLADLISFLQRNMGQYRQNPQFSLRGNSLPVVLAQCLPVTQSKPPVVLPALSKQPQVESVYIQPALPTANPTQPKAARSREFKELLLVFTGVGLVALIILTIIILLIVHIFVH